MIGSNYYKPHCGIKLMNPIMYNIYKIIRFVIIGLGLTIVIGWIYMAIIVVYDFVQWI